jgi:CheY-like chemotaxis protein
VAGLRNQVLILEDDAALLNALVEAFKKEGFIVHGTGRPAEAESLLEKHPIATLFIDCLLPEISGVEFVEKIRPTQAAEVLDVVLMSGIFTDPGFVKESLRATKAKHFLKKPFDLSEALGLVDKPIAPEAPTETGPIHPRKVLYGLFSKGKLSIREKKKAIEALDEIHGYDLPFIYSLLVESKASGHLNVAVSNGDFFGVSLSQGRIITADIPDKETYLGKLLVDSGYVHPDDLNFVLKEGNTGKKIGEKLISYFFISPHALDSVVLTQMSIRLSKTIIEKNVYINFVDADVELSNPSVGPEQFAGFLHDWIASKISLSWLKVNYTQWSSAPLVKTPLYRADHPALQAPLVSALQGIADILSSGQTLSQIIDSQKFSEEPLYKALHYLLTRGLLVFSEQNTAINPADRLKMLKKLHTQFLGKNKLEIFDIMVQMTGGAESDADFVIREFAQMLGAQPAAEHKDLHSIYQQITTLGQQAYEFARTGNRAKMRDELAKGAVELKLKAGQNYDEAKNLLQKSMFKQAAELLKKAQAIDPHLAGIKTYLIWAKLGKLDSEPKRQEALHALEMDILQIPPEDKFDATFHFVQGLLAKAKGDFVSAKKSFEKAMAMDSAMIVARREMTFLASQASQKKDVFNRDLKDVVGSFFRRK